jgi:hypothetical protein
VEGRVIGSLRRTLKSRGIRPFFDPDVVDKPDGVLILGRRRVAVECTYITQQRLLKAFRSKAERLHKMYRVVTPYEPHLWVSQSVAAKEKKFQTYLGNGNAEAAWLLLHTSVHAPVLRSFGAINEALTIALLRLGAHLVPHNFERIWLTELGDDPPRVIELYGPDTPPPTLKLDEVFPSLNDYPALVYMEGKHILTATTERRVSFDLTDANVITEYLNPLDPTHLIDRTPYAEPIGRFLARPGYGIIQRGPLHD